MSQSAAKTNATTSCSKQSRNTLLQSVVSYLLSNYHETGRYEDMIPAEQVHSLVNDSGVVNETISFITSTRLVKSTFKSALYDKESKVFHGLAKSIQPDLCSKQECDNQQHFESVQPIWPSSLLSMLSAMFDQKLLCDCFIRVCPWEGESTYIPCHASVLAAASQVVRNEMINQIGFKSDTLVIECANVGVAEWQAVLKFIYKGTIDVAPNDGIKVWKLSVFLEIEHLTCSLQGMLKERKVKMPPMKVAREFTSLALSYLPCNADVSGSMSSRDHITGHDSLFNLSDAALPVDGASSSYVNNIIDAVYKNSSQIESSTSAVDDSDVIGADQHEQEPTSKRRKMYKPRKVAKINNALAEQEADGNCADTQDDCHVLNSVDTVPCDSEFLLHQGGVKLESSASDDSGAHDDHCQEDCDLAAGDAHAARSALAVGDALAAGDAPAAGNALVSGDAFPSGDALTAGDSLAESDAIAASDALPEGDEHSLFPAPLVIAPIDDYATPTDDYATCIDDYTSSHSLDRMKIAAASAALENDMGKAFEGDASGSQARGNSMLYGLLNSDTTAVGGSTPMLKSLLATSAPRATKSTKSSKYTSHSNSDNDVTDVRESSIANDDSTKDSDYRPYNAKHSTRRKHTSSRRSVAPSSGADVTANDDSKRTVAAAATMPRGLQSVLRWNRSDLQQEKRQQTSRCAVRGGGGTGSEFSASSLLLSMISKAEQQPTKAVVDTAAAAENHRVAGPVTSKRSKPKTPPPPSLTTAATGPSSLTTAATGRVSASQILVSLLENRNNQNSNRRRSTRASSSAVRANEHVTPAAKSGSATQQAGMMFSQVLQGLASAYSSPIGNTSDSRDGGSTPAAATVTSDAVTRPLPTQQQQHSQQKPQASLSLNVTIKNLLEKEIDDSFRSSTRVKQLLQKETDDSFRSSTSVKRLLQKETDDSFRSSTSVKRLLQKETDDSFCSSTSVKQLLQKETDDSFRSSTSVKRLLQKETDDSFCSSTSVKQLLQKETDDSFRSSTSVKQLLQKETDDSFRSSTRVKQLLQKETDDSFRSSTRVKQLLQKETDDSFRSSTSVKRLLQKETDDSFRSSTSVKRLLQKETDDSFCSSTSVKQLLQKETDDSFRSSMDVKSNGSRRLSLSSKSPQTTGASTSGQAQTATSSAPLSTLRMTFQRSGADYAVKSNTVENQTNTNSDASKTACITIDEDDDDDDEAGAEAVLNDDNSAEHVINSGSTANTRLSHADVFDALTTSATETSSSQLEQLLTASNNGKMLSCGALSSSRDSPASNTSDLDTVAENIASSWSRLQCLLAESDAPASAQTPPDDVSAVGTQDNGDSLSQTATALVAKNRQSLPSLSRFPALNTIDVIEDLGSISSPGKNTESDDMDSTEDISLSDQQYLQQQQLTHTTAVESTISNNKNLSSVEDANRTVRFNSAMESV